jgi:hypothetical protein
MKKIFLSLFVVSSFCGMAQNVGINTTTPQAALDINGDLILRSSPLALVNGNNNDIDISTTKSAHYVVTGTSSVFYLTGFQNGIDGKTFSVYNPSGFIMIIKHLSALSSAGNQIHTGTGLDFTMNSFSTVTFRYQTNDNAWHIVSTGNDFNNPWVNTSSGQVYNVNSSNVGVGTVGDAPTKFTVRQSGIGIAQEGGLGGAQVGFYTTSVSAYIQTHNNFDLLFSTNNGTAQMTLQKATGNLSVGFTGSTARLSVSRGTSTSAFDGTAAFYGTTHISHFNYGTTEDTYIRGGKDNAKVIMADNPGGAVGIGTANTTGYKLAVNGNIRAKEVVVETAWADYVFDDDYHLQPLHEVEKFIKANKHLPNIPAAEEIQKNGLRTAELQTKMMSKIEELTLYVIELEKKLEALNQIINAKK